MKKKIKILLYGLIGWFFIVSIIIFPSLLFRKKYITFIGRDDGRFIDNVKYLYLYFLDKKHSLRENVVFITENSEVYSILKKNNFPVEKYPSLKSIKILLQTKLLIVDNWMWIKNFKFYLLKWSKKLQIWHGVGFKFIELNNKMDFKSKKSILVSKIIGRYPSYDFVISTSPFYTKNVFSKAFEAKEIWETGYPRNDIFFRKVKEKEYLFTDKQVIDKTLKAKETGKKIILYTHTFRDKGGDPIKDNILDFAQLNKFLEENNMLLILKFHPDPNFDYTKYEKYENILFYDNSKDVYPLMKEIDCLITDYSSIYMDFLLAGKPVLFFPYDLSRYTSRDRKIQFEYDWITPGIKVYNQKELELALKDILVLGVDDFKKQREEISKLAFKYHDGLSSKRIFDKVLAKLKQKEK
jgi:CDP-glycerol glycerophosphotransferase